MTLPAGAMTLADKQAVNAALLASGALIAEMNVVRKHLSAIKGGRLAAAARPARVVTLVISDIPGDDPGAIASGPTLPDPSTESDALEIARRWSLDLTPAARADFEAEEEAPKPGEFETDVRSGAAPSLALDAAADVARRDGLTPVIVGDALEGEARGVGTVNAGIATLSRRRPCCCRAARRRSRSAAAPPGGGRNDEFLLGLAVALTGAPNIWAIAGDSKGIDGTEDPAGAIVGPLARAKLAGLDARALLDTHDSYAVFHRLDDLVRTGPTVTDVNDIRAILVAPAQWRGSLALRRIPQTSVQ